MEKLSNFYGYTLDVFLEDDINEDVAITKSLLIELVNESINAMTIMNSIDNALGNDSNYTISNLLESLKDKQNKIMSIQENLNEFFDDLDSIQNKIEDYLDHKF